MVILQNLAQYFHLYGFILGLSVVLGMWLIQKKAQSLGYASAALDNLFIWVILGGILGARLWHVATDISYYISQPLAALMIWQGGLSILGAVAGGGLAAWWVLRTQPSSVPASQLTFPLVLDLAVFGLPLAQALGRLGNYVNQELYGWPTTLPWAIEIEPAYRLSGFEQFSTFHPLFAYELIVMIIFGACIWWWAAQPAVKTGWLMGKIGSGRWFAFYVLYYSVIRFSLDFVRIDKTVIAGTGLGVNQMLLALIAFIAGFFLLRRRRPPKHD